MPVNNGRGFLRPFAAGENEMSKDTEIKIVQVCRGCGGEGESYCCEGYPVERHFATEDADGDRIFLDPNRDRTYLDPCAATATVDYRRRRSA